MADNTIEIDLGRPVRVAELPALGLSFLHWWGSELIDALPTRLRRALPQRKSQVLIHIGAEFWRISRPDVADVIIDSHLADADLPAEVARAVPDIGERRLVILIRRDQALIRRVRLPMITDARVRPAIELQLDKLSPFKPENIRFACRVVERRIEDNDMDVDVAIVPAKEFSEIEGRLALAGLKPNIIDIEGPAGDPLGFNLRDEGRSALDRKYRMANAGLAAGAVLAWLMAYYALGAAGEAEVASWQAKIAELRPQALRAADLAQQIQALSQPIEIAGGRTGPGAIDILKELTDRFPDTAHLFELRVEGGVVKAIGSASDAPALIGKLDATRVFSEVRFSAPVTRRQGTSLDRFEIALKLKDAKR